MEPMLIPVLAQQVINVAAEGEAVSQVIIPIVALLIPIIIVPTALGIRFAQKNREMEHLERMRALELGRPMLDDEGEPTPMGFALKIGAGVPASAMGIAWIASLTLHNTDLSHGAWQAAVAIAAVALVCGTVLALRAFGLAHQLQSGRAEADRKPAFDPDAYDHIGSRG